MEHLIPEELRWQPDLTSRRVDEQRVVDIAFMPMEPRLRNELITRAYGDMAQAMARVLGTANTTWAGFGLWASHTIGGFLSLPIPGINRLFARAFGDGNRDVFANIGRAHTTFLATVGQAHLAGDDIHAAWHTCQAELRRRLDAPAGEPRVGVEDDFWLRPFDPRLEPAGPNHNELLVTGFRAYYRSLLATDADERSRHILLGNCLLALHEQKLLALAISTGFRGWVRTLTTCWRFFENRVTWRNRNPGAWRLRLEHRWIHLATKRLVGVGLPNGKVSAGKPVPAGENPVRVEPAHDDDETQQLKAQRLIVDRDTDDLLAEVFRVFQVDGRPAVCWNDLRDRMAYIIALFAEHQRSTFWLDEFDRPIRPPTWGPFQKRLAALMDRFDESPTPPVASGLERSPQSHDQLDELRRQATHLPIERLQSKRLSDASRSIENLDFSAIRDDTKLRYSIAVQDGGVLSPAICAAARTTFQRFPSLWFMALLVRSLPDDYAAAIGSHALARITGLASEPFRRAGETAQFVHDLLEEHDGWDNGTLEYEGGAYQSIQGVRSMHSLVAKWLARDGWPREYGAAMNQEDMLGAALTFGVSSVQMMDAIDPMLLSNDERSAYVQFWLGIGYFQGLALETVTAVDPAAAPLPKSTHPDSPAAALVRRPLTYPEAEALAVQVWGRHRARSIDGVRLSEALVEGVSDGFPRPVYWLAPGIMQAFGIDEVTVPMMIGTGVGRRRANIVAGGTRFMFRNRALRPVAQWLIRLIGRRWIMPFLEQGRTRPYRRPQTPSDDERLALAARDSELWPSTCSALSAPPAPPHPEPRKQRDRRRRRAA